jgi:hypothetical protein
MTTYHVPAISFSEALRQLKEGKAIARSGWNGKGMFLQLEPAKTSMVMGEEPLKYRAFIQLFTAQGDIVPWVASQSDLLENDWYVLIDEE